MPTMAAPDSGADDVCIGVLVDRGSASDELAAASNGDDDNGGAPVDGLVAALTLAVADKGVNLWRHSEFPKMCDETKHAREAVDTKYLALFPIRELERVLAGGHGAAV